jgi:pyruvate dehydrogenase (quinone)
MDLGPLAIDVLSPEPGRSLSIMKTGEVLVQMLRGAGVTRVHGVSGDSLNAFTDAIRSNGDIEWVHVRHEEAGAFAAGGEAHLTDKLAVCAGSCGPGNLQVIDGLFDCCRRLLRC